MKKTGAAVLAPERGAGGTRARIQELLLGEGPTTAAALAARLHLTTAAVRRHLDAMVADGVLLARDPRPTPWRSRGRGRPARYYALSDTGHERAHHGYDQLAADALAFLAKRDAVAEFAQARAAGLRERYAGRVRGAADLAVALSADGYAATVHEVPSGTQICQHHCPVAQVATVFPQLCEAETEALGALLGTHVQRLATIAHGDGVCTTHVPAHAPTAAATPSRPKTSPPKGAR